MPSDGEIRAGCQLRLVGAEVDLARRLVVRPSGATRLSPTEARLLGYLADRPGQPVSKERLLEEVWNYRAGVHSRTVITTVERLRRKIEVDPSRPQHVVTDGGGYRYEPPARVGADLVGRDALLQELLAALADGAPLLTLGGPGGIGKTHLAREIAAAAAARRFTVGWVDLEGVRAGSEALGRVARALDMPGAGLERLSRALAHRAPFVLVLDDLDALTPEAAAFGPLVGTAGLSIVATSREPLALPAERHVPLGPLTGPEARQLVCARAGVDPATLDPDAVEKICEVTEGLPLAIVLAAPWLGVLGADEIAARLLVLPPLRDAPGPGRHRGLALCLERSWEALDAPSQRALGLVCGVPGPLPLAAFEAVLDDPRALDLLARLQQRSWWAVSGGRVHVPASIRAFVAERAPGHGPVAFDRAWAWAVETFRRARPELPGLPFERSVSEHLQRDLPMLWALVGLAPRGLERARFASALASAALAIGVFPPPGRVDEAAEDGEADPKLVARMACYRAQMLGRTGGPALDELRAARTLAERAEDTQLALWCSVLIGAALERTGALDEAERELAAPMGAQTPPPIRAGAAYELAWVAFSRGQWERGLEGLRVAEEIARRGQAAYRMEMMVASSIALCEQRLGRRLEAESQMRRVIQLSEALGCPDDTAIAKINLAGFCTVDGRAREAQRLLQEAIVHLRRHGLLRAEGDALVELSRSESALGRLERAAQLAAEAGEVYRAARFPQGELRSLHRLARIEHARERLDEALRRYEQVIRLADDLGVRPIAGDARALAALAAAERGETERSRALRAAAGTDLGDVDLLAVVDAALASRGWPEVRQRLCTAEIERMLAH